MNRVKKAFSNRWVILLTASVLFWAKTILAYYVDFSLGVEGSVQTFILWINPIATTLLMFGVFLYVKKFKPALVVLFLMDLLNTVILYLNVIFYREFTDFVTIKSILGFSKVSQGISGSSFALMKPHDVLYWIDLAVFLGILIYLFAKRKEIVSKPAKKNCCHRCELFGCVDLLDQPIHE
jgi:lipoteichoic acid synthase